MARIDDLVEAYAAHIALPWQTGLAGPERAIFIVYPKQDERRIRARKANFELVTAQAGHGWREVDLATSFGDWMMGLDYREEYFANPEDLTLKLKDFHAYIANKVEAVLRAEGVDDQTVVAILGVASLLGFARVSELMRSIEPAIRGRVLVFFPGEYDNNVYRLLDARDGWNYLAVPITAPNGVHAT